MVSSYSFKNGWLIFLRLSVLHAERLDPTKPLPVERGRERAILGSIAESINLESPTPVTKEVISSPGYNKQRQHLRRLTTGKKGINKCRLQLFVCRQVSKVAAHPARSPVVGPGAWEAICGCLRWRGRPADGLITQLIKAAVAPSQLTDCIVVSVTWLHRRCGWLSGDQKRIGGILSFG